MMISSGSWSRQRTISTRWRSPTERSAIMESGLSVRPYSVDTAVIRFFRSPMGSVSVSASAMFSATVSASNSEKCWNTMPMPSLRAAAGFGMVTALPFQRISPAVGCSAPYRIFTSVDLPAPFSPRSAWISFGLMAKSMLSLARSVAKSLVMPIASSVGSPGKRWKPVAAVASVASLIRLAPPVRHRGMISAPRRVPAVRRPSSRRSPPAASNARLRRRSDRPGGRSGRVGCRPRRAGG